MSELFDLSITICYSNYSILLFHMQDSTSRSSVIYLTLLSYRIYDSVLISRMLGFVGVTEKALLTNSCLIFAYIAPGNVVTKEC